MFRQLSFDTSNSDVHVALIQDGSAIGQRVFSVVDAASGTARQEAANLLIPGIDQLMREAAWSKTDLDCIIVGTGPGGFTGIRTAVVTARALAQALCLPLYPVSLLECITSAVPGISAIALYATAGHYFLAKTIADEVVSFYSGQAEIANFVEGIPVIYADARAQTAWRSADQPALLASSPEIRDLPEIPNVAVQQAKFAWKRLSLKVEAIYERLNGLDVRTGTEAQPHQQELRSELCREFPYELVVPTYLRAPSVTLKKTNV